MQKTTIIAILLIIALIAGGFLIYFYKNQSSQNNLYTGSSGNINSNNVQPGSGSSGTPQTTPKTYNIMIQNTAFQTPMLTINVGDTVVWTNNDVMQHTVTSDSGNELSSSPLGGASSGGYYSSPTSGGTYPHTFTTAGTYNYHCSIHPGMRGIIIVQ